MGCGPVHCFQTWIKFAVRGRSQRSEFLIGKQYGLELNADKTVLLRVRADGDIFGPDGKAIKTKDNAIYLGGLVSTDGKPRAELTRRLGEAKGIFQKLCSVWSHANLTRARKIQV